MAIRVVFCFDYDYDDAAAADDLQNCNEKYRILLIVQVLYYSIVFGHLTRNRIVESYT